MIQLELEFDGTVFVPQRPVDLPAGYKVTVSVETQQVPPPATPVNSLLELAKIAEQFPSDPNDPTDLSIQHDHYLYGLPKKPL